MRKLILTAAVAALTLSSCGSGKQPDIKKDYKDYLDYTFDGDYSISDVTERQGDGFSERVWMISYTDPKGKEQTEEISVPNFGKGAVVKNSEDNIIKNEYDWAMMSFICGLCDEAVHDELTSKVMSPYFEFSEDHSLWHAEGDGFTVYFEYKNCRLFDPDDDTVAASLDPESGTKYSGVNLKDWAQDKYNGLWISIVITDASRTEEFVEKLTEFGSDYVEYTVDPKNYCFELHAPDSSGQSQLVAAGCRVLGEETDAELFDMQYIVDKIKAEG